MRSGLSSFRSTPNVLRNVSRKLFQPTPKDENVYGEIECELIKVPPSTEITPKNIATIKQLTTANAVYIVQNKYKDKKKNRKLFYVHFDRGICESVAANISDDNAEKMGISGSIEQERKTLNHSDLEKIEKIVNANGKRKLALHYIDLDKELKENQAQKNNAIPESEDWSVDQEAASLSEEEKITNLKKAAATLNPANIPAPPAFYTPAPWERAPQAASAAISPENLAEGRKKLSGNTSGLNERIAILTQEIAKLTQENAKLQDNLENKKKESNIVEEKLNHKIEELITANEQLTTTYKSATDWINTFEKKIQKANTDNAEKNKEIQRLIDELTKLTVQTASVLAHSSTSEANANMTSIQLTESSSIEVNTILGDLNAKIKSLTIASTGEQQQALAEALRHLHNLLQVEPDKKLANEFALHTSNFIDAFQSGDKQAKLNALSDYEKNCVNLSGWEKFKVALAAVIGAAAGIILGVTIKVGVCATIGFFIGGPAGGAVGAIAGLFSGTFDALGIGLVSGAVGVGVAGGVLGGLGMFKHEKAPIKTAAAEIHQLGKTMADSLKP